MSEGVEVELEGGGERAATYPHSHYNLAHSFLIPHTFIDNLELNRVGVAGG